MPLGAVAVIVVSPSASAVTTPVPLTVAAAGFVLFQENGTPPIGALDRSNAVAESERDEATATVALAGETVTLATSGSGGSTPSSLHAPKVPVPAVHEPAASRCSDMPIASVPFCDAPMSMEVRPVAAPFVAANTPSYEMNSTTVFALSTSAIASGEPFWMPFAG